MAYYFRSEKEEERVRRKVREVDKYHLLGCYIIRSNQFGTGLADHSVTWCNGHVLKCRYITFLLLLLLLHHIPSPSLPLLLILKSDYPCSWGNRRRVNTFCLFELVFARECTVFIHSTTPVVVTYRCITERHYELHNISCGYICKVWVKGSYKGKDNESPCSRFHPLASQKQLVYRAVLGSRDPDGSNIQREV